MRESLTELASKKRNWQKTKNWTLWRRDQLGYMYDSYWCLYYFYFDFIVFWLYFWYIMYVCLTIPLLSVLVRIYIYIHRESKKRDTILLSIASPNIDRFSKFFHHQTQQETFNSAIIKISPHLKCVAILPCEILEFKNRSISVSHWWSQSACRN